MHLPKIATNKLCWCLCLSDSILTGCRCAAKALCEGNLALVPSASQWPPLLCFLLHQVSPIISRRGTGSDFHRRSCTSHPVPCLFTGGWILQPLWWKGRKLGASCPREFKLIPSTCRRIARTTGAAGLQFGFNSVVSLNLISEGTFFSVYLCLTPEGTGAFILVRQKVERNPEQSIKWAVILHWYQMFDRVLCRIKRPKYYMCTMHTMYIFKF